MTVAPTVSSPETILDTGERNTAMWMHLSPLLAFMILGPLAVVAPLVFWLARRDASPFVDDHGREVVNMSITGVIVFFVGMVTVIGVLVLWLPWAVAALVGVVRGAQAASAGQYFRYPMTIRFISPPSA